MHPSDAWQYAATWGSYMTAGDPGACMYGFDERCRPQSEEHRADVIAWLENECRPLVLANPADYDEDELENMDSFLAYIRTAPVESGAMTRTGPETEFRNWHHIPAFPEGVDAFTQGYLEAVAFTDMQDSGDDAHGCEFAPESVEAAAADCARFQKENAAPLAIAYGDEYDEYQAGRDFWFARNGHGVGFTDRDAIPDAVAEALQGNARGWPERSVYAGDDGLAYIE